MRNFILAFISFPICTYLFGIIIDLFIDLGAISYIGGFVASVFVNGSLLRNRGPLNSISFEEGQNLTERSWNDLQTKQLYWEEEQRRKSNKFNKNSKNKKFTYEINNQDELNNLKTLEAPFGYYLDENYGYSEVTHIIKNLPPAKYRTKEEQQEMSFNCGKEKIFYDEERILNKIILPIKLCNKCINS